MIPEHKKNTGSSALPRIIVDGDSCPVEIRALLFRWRERGRISVEVFSNRPLPIERSVLTIVDSETTVDEVIIALLTALEPLDRDGIVVVTRDIPLAERVVAMGVEAINDRGDRFDPATIAERRSIRDRNAEIRALGLERIESRRGFGRKEVKAFADTLDRILSEIIVAKKI